MTEAEIEKAASEFAVDYHGTALAAVNYPGTVAGYIAGAEHAGAKWVKCSDALPEKDDWVLTYSWGSGVHFERYVGLIYKPDGRIVPKFSDGGDNWQFEFTPSYWSRTPPAPEAESK
jgi:hypothetical protein